MAFRFRREAGQLVAADESMDGGVLRLDPRGLDVPVTDMSVTFPAA